MAYRSAEVLPDRCGGQERILVRLVGTCTRAYQGSTTDDITQRAKVSYYPCCTRPTHVALPPRYTAGKNSGHRAHGAQLWKGHGPWAARFFAATLDV